MAGYLQARELGVKWGVGMECEQLMGAAVHQMDFH